MSLLNNYNLTNAQTQACVHLKNELAEGDTVAPTEGALTLAERMDANRKKCKSGEMERCRDLYKNVDFLCGSATEVEWLWIICHYILTQTRAKLTPIFSKPWCFSR